MSKNEPSVARAPCVSRDRPEHARGPAGGGRGGDGRAAARDPARDRHQHERAGRTRRVLAGLYPGRSHFYVECV